MFKVSSYVNTFYASGKTEGVSKETFEKFKNTFSIFFTELLGLLPEEGNKNNDEDFGKLVDSLLDLRMKLKRKRIFHWLTQ